MTGFDFGIVLLILAFIATSQMQNPNIVSKTKNFFGVAVLHITFLAACIVVMVPLVILGYIALFIL